MQTQWLTNDISDRHPWQSAPPTELSEEQLALVMGGDFWEGLAKAVAGVGAIAAAVAAVIVAPQITIPLAVTAATAALGGAKTAVDGAVEAYDDRHTWDDGAASRNPRG